MDSQWEDCSYRIESLNILLHMVGRIEDGLKAVSKIMEVENYDNDIVRNEIGEILDNLSEDLDQSLPSLPTQGVTKLDRLTRERRILEWDFIKNDADNLRRNIYENPIQELISEVEDYMFRFKNLAIEVWDIYIYIYYVCGC